MDLLHVAQRRFEQLAPLLNCLMTQQNSDAIECWLRDQVCPVAEMLGENARFRKWATWAPETLSKMSGSPQRLHVESVDSALVRAAKAASEAARECLLNSAPSVPITPDPDIAGSEANVSVLPRDTPTELVTDWIATRPWFDLVAPGEYFTGHRFLHLKSGHIEHTRRFHEQGDPRVPLGDYVSRGMFARIRYYAGEINSVVQRCILAKPGTEPGHFERIEAVFDAKAEMIRTIAALTEACNQGIEARLRDACTTLVQVYAAYSPNPRLDWLGCSRSQVEVEGQRVRQAICPPGIIRLVERRGPGSFRYRGQIKARLCRPDVITGIAGALATVANLYRRPQEPEELIECLCAEKRLVVVDRRPRVAYWEGHALTKPWDNNAVVWDLLWKLAERAKQGKSLSQDEVIPPGENPSKVKHRRSRLTKFIPAALNELIKPVTGGYRLDLVPQQIALLEIGNDDQVVEVVLWNM